MAASISVSFIVAESGFRNTFTSAEYVSVFLVSGLTSGSGIFMEAYNTVVATYPFGSIHPNNSRLIADDFDVKPYLNSTTQCKVYVKYHPIDLSSVYSPVITFNGTTREIQTNYDSAGNKMTVNYKAGASGDPGAHTSDGDGIVTVLGQIVRSKAYGILEIERVEYDDPTPRLTYIDALNSDVFWGQPKWTWLIRDICITKILYTSGFKCRYVIEYDWQTHAKTVVYRDQISGTIPSDVNTNPDLTVGRGNGWSNWYVNRQRAFSGLALPGSFSG